MITYTELRRLSLDFRRLSSNFLNSTDDTAATMIQRFKKYIDDTPFISGIISDAIGEVDYDWQNCFRQSKHSGWHEIEVPVDEACHVKAMYDYLDYIISNGSNILGIAMHYPHSQKKFNEIIQHFLDIAFKPLIDFINDAISKEMILMEEQKPLGVTQNIGTVYGTVNQLGGGTCGGSRCARPWRASRSGSTSGSSTCAAVLGRVACRSESTRRPYGGCSR